MKKIISFLLTLGVISSYTVHAEKSDMVEIYVDCKVTESGDGSVGMPYKTIEEAKSFIRNLKVEGEYPEGGVKVWIREGNYKVDKAITFTAEDSGVDGAPVIYQAYPLEEVNFVGGSEISLGDFKVSDDERIAEDLKGKIYSYNLKENSVTPYDKLYCTGHSQYFMQFVLPDEIDKESVMKNVPEVFYNDNITQIARWPNEDYTRVGEVINAGTPIKKMNDAGEVTKLDDVEPMTFKVDIEKERLEQWKKENEAWLFGYWFYDWSDMTTPIKAIDAEKGIITTKYPSPYLVKKGQRFYIYNALCELDIPGEWYYDSLSGDFFIYPLDNNSESKIVLGFSSSDLVDFNGASNIVLKDLKFSGTRSTGIAVSGGENINIFGCEVKNVSGTGIYVNGNNHIVDSCHVYNVGSTGISINGGNRETLEPGGNVATNNWIHNFGRLFRTYNGGLTISGVGNSVRYNLIYEGPHLGIQFGGNDNLIEYNDVSKVLKEAADMGAMYTNCTYTTGRGIVLRGNIVHDIATDSDHTGQYSVYLDNTTSGVTVEGNLFYNLIDGVFVNGGRENTIKNNTFVDIKNVAIQISDIGLATGWGELSTPEALAAEGVGEGLLSTSEAYSKYPGLSGMHLEVNPRAPKNNVIKDNINNSVGQAVKIANFTDGGSTATEADVRKWSEISDGINVDKDIFVDSEKKNFNLNTSVEDKLPDYEGVDFNKAGLITSRLKNTLREDAIALAIDKPVAYVNWKRKMIDENDLKIVPKIKDNLTYVPVRFMAEMLGGNVEFNDGVISIEYNGKKLELKNASNIAKIDGQEVELNGACFIENSRTYVPLRSCSNLFGKEVFWDDAGLIIISDRDMTELFDSDMIKNLVDRM